jgi:hypothetical protein
MLEQARDIAEKEEERADLDHAAFILSADVKLFATTNTADAVLREAQNELDAEIRTQLSPAPHQFELRRVQPAENRGRSF